MAAICMLNRSLNLYRCFRRSSSLDFASDAMAVAVVGRKGKMNKPCLPPIICSAPLERSSEVQQQLLTEEEAQETRASFSLVREMITVLIVKLRIRSYMRLS
ncbi:uncharacterized protein LOC121971551 [Zingiber officinale]|uniref:uncharacterized protein LOC121971551 n=1 Tax=Zingiber officinale TaxID=94328 RepID=UPI001C4D6D8E|nr:uncharacterized protein LOC121971551 [Zingiber officinale]